MHPKLDFTRRAFVGAMAAAPLVGQGGGWTDLFNGKDLTGWRPQTGPGSWTVADGLLTANGPMCHLFYAGPFHNADFKNFELQVECMTRQRCNSGVYIHTAWQETNWPQKGCEIQINNTQPGEHKKTASLYNLRNIYRQFVPDEQWFTLNVLVRGSSVQVRLNGMLTVDYVQPDPPYVPTTGMERQRFLDHGTIALQCHDPGSYARFRSVRVRPLPDDTPTPVDMTVPAADATFKKILDTGGRGIPMLDLHVHPKNGLSIEQALALSHHGGIMYGLAVNAGQAQPVTDDAGLLRWIESLKLLPVFTGMQAEGREWVGMFSRAAVAQCDYVFSDSMTWTDNHGKRMRTWLADEIGTITNPQEFMDTLVDRAVGILEREPVDIYANPTYVPDQLQKDYETLWTDERRRRIAEAASKNGVAVELNNRYKLPSASFVKQMKAAGCKFTFGTNNAGPDDVGRCEYSLQMVEECGLTQQDFFVPLDVGTTKAIDRKGDALKKA